MMRIYRNWVMAMLLCLYLVACVSGVSTPNSTAVPPTSGMESETTPASTQSVKLGIKKINEKIYHDQYVTGIKWNPIANQFALSFIGVVRLFDANTFQEEQNIFSLAPAYNISAPVFSPNGELLYLYTRLKGLQVHDSRTGDLLREVAPEYQSFCLLNDAFGSVISADSRSLFTSVDDYREKPLVFVEIQRWDTLSLQCEVLSRIEGHFRSLDISSDGKYLLASTGKRTAVSNDLLLEDGEIVIWDVESGEQVCFIKNEGSFAHFKPLESMILVANPRLDKLSYWDVTTCSLDHEIEGITTYYDFAFSSDGKIIALWEDMSISVLDAESGALLRKISDSSLKNTPINYLHSYLAFSSDGQYLLSVLNQDPVESLVVLWNIEK